MVQTSLSQTQQQRLQQVLAPQMRQSLEFLQVPLLELRALLQKELELNPTIEEEPTESTPIEVEPGADETPEDQEIDFDEEFQVLSRLNDEWADYFQQTQSARSYSSDEQAKHDFLIESAQQGPSLQEHLRRQLDLSELEGKEYDIAEILVGSINDDGYLTINIGELAETSGWPIEHIEEILDQIRDFDPIGVAARDIEESLLLQLERLGIKDGPTISIVRHHLQALGAKKYKEIARDLDLSLSSVQHIADFISTLEPKPGRRFSSDTPTYILPEAVVQKINDDYMVFLNDDQLPHLRISKHYQQLMEQQETTDDVKNYIKEKVRSSLFLIKSIHQRQQTIRRIAEEIVRVQKGFFEHGVSHLKPLTMTEVAADLELHETTISRAIANKYMQTPRGTYEMKYFFTPGYQTADGESVSNKAIKETIRQLIAQERLVKPLSDQAIAGHLKEQGFNVARRTVAKYREELHIPPSHQRKRK